MQPTVMTTGTILTIVANCVIAAVAVLQGVDWVHVVGGQAAGWITAIVAMLNVGLHSFTGPSSAHLTAAAKRDLNVSG